MEQLYQPVGGNLWLSTIVALIPIVVLFVLLAVVRIAAQWAALVTLAISLVISVLVWKLPIGLALNSTLLGACFGLFPIVWTLSTPSSSTTSWWTQDTSTPSATHSPA